MEFTIEVSFAVMPAFFFNKPFFAPGGGGSDRTKQDPDKDWSDHYGHQVHSQAEVHEKRSGEWDARTAFCMEKSVFQAQIFGRYSISVRQCLHNIGMFLNWCNVSIKTSCESFCNLFEYYWLASILFLMSMYLWKLETGTQHCFLKVYACPKSRHLWWSCAHYEYIMRILYYL